MAEQPEEAAEIQEGPAEEHVSDPFRLFREARPGFSPADLQTRARSHKQGSRLGFQLGPCAGYHGNSPEDASIKMPQ